MLYPPPPLIIVLFLIGIAILSYLFGSVNFAIVWTRVFLHDDIRKYGSGNAGMTNVLRTYGAMPAVLTIVGDVGKSVAAAFLGRLLFAVLLGQDAVLEPVCGMYLAAIFCMVGHSRPLYFGFKGGKCVLVGAGAALSISPVVCLVLLAVFLVQFAFSRIVSLGSIIVAALFPVATLVYWLVMGASVPSVLFSTLCSVIMAVMVIWLHRSNIERLKNGTEYRFGQKKNS